MRRLLTATLAAAFGLVLLSGDASAAGCFKKKHHVAPCPPPAPVCVYVPPPCPPPAPVCYCPPVKAKHKLLGKHLGHKAKAC